MKKKSVVLMLVFALMTLLSRPLAADVGPKPSVTVNIENAPDQPYFMALLSKKEQYGPWSVVSAEDADLSGKSGNEQLAFSFFAAYKDPDGYHFLGNMSGDLQGRDEYRWGYYPPDEFKIAIYCPQDGTFKLSGPLERDAFDSYFSVDFNAADLAAAEDPQILITFLYFLLRVVLTIVIEFIIGQIMGYRSRGERRAIIIVNLVTQVLLNAFLTFMDYFGGGMVWLIMFPLGELAVFLIELVIYLFVMKRKKKLRTFLYTLIANIVSAGLTLLAVVIQWSN